jgi:hypothetical protein
MTMMRERERTASFAQASMTMAKSASIAALSAALLDESCEFSDDFECRSIPTGSTFLILVAPPLSAILCLAKCRVVTAVVTPLSPTICVIFSSCQQE